MLHRAKETGLSRGATLTLRRHPVQTLALDDDLAAILAGENGSIQVVAREALVVELFRRGRLSIGKACELLHLTREAFAQRAADLGIPYFLMNKADWTADLATIEAWRQS